MKNLNILIVEDDSSSELFYRTVLEKNGFGVFSGTSDILNLIQKHSINVVFLDICMKPVDGYEWAKLIREKFPNIGIIAQTAQAHINKRNDDNFDIILYKPIPPKDILKSIEMYECDTI